MPSIGRVDLSDLTLAHQMVRRTSIVKLIGSSHISSLMVWMGLIALSPASRRSRKSAAFTPTTILSHTKRPYNMGLGLDGNGQQLGAEWWDAAKALMPPQPARWMEVESGEYADVTAVDEGGGGCSFAPAPGASRVRASPDGGA